MGTMTPLASVMLLAFLFLIALALVIWALLLPRQKPAPKPEREREAVAPPPRESLISNDDVRGAKSAGPKRPAAPDDAFERFLRAGRENDRD